MRLRHIAASAAMLASCLSARADEFRLFNVNGIFDNGAKVTGTVDLDLSDVFDAYPYNSIANATVTSGSKSYLLSGTNGEFEYTISGPPRSGVGFFGDGAQLLLVFTTPVAGVLAGYNGGPLDTQYSFLKLPVPFTPFYKLKSGTLTPVPTPEPSSLALLGTGVLGVIGVARRRFSRA